MSPVGVGDGRSRSAARCLAVTLAAVAGCCWSCTSPEDLARGDVGPSTVSVTTAEPAPSPPPAPEIEDLTAATAPGVGRLEIARGGRRRFAIELDAGWMVRVVAEQAGGDVALILYHPDGGEALRMDRPQGGSGVERVTLVAETTGRHLIGVEEAGTPGPFRLVLSEGPRPARPEDRLCAQAERTFMAARSAEKGPESLWGAAEVGYRHAAELWRECGDECGWAVATARLGETLGLLDRDGEAESAFRAALPGLEAAGEDARSAELHNSLGVRARERSDYPAAREHYLQAERLGRRSHNVPAVLTALGNRSVVLTYSGRLEEALDALDDQRSLAEAEHDAKAEVAARHRRAELFLEAGDPQRAEEELNEALRGALEARNETGIAASRWRLGRARLLLGDLAAAERHFEEALQRYTALESGYEVAGVWNDLGRVYRHQARFDEALDAFGRAEALYTGLNARRDAATARMHRAWALEGAGDADGSIAVYRRVIDEFEELEDGSRLASAHHGLARALRLRGDLPAALTAIDQAIAWVEDRANSFRSPELESAYNGRIHDYYALKVDLLMRLHLREPGADYDDAAFATVERGRARALLEKLVQSRGAARRAVDPSLAAAGSSLERQVVGHQIGLRKDSGNVEEDRRLRSELHRLQGESARVEAQLRARDPRYASLTLPEPPDLETVRRELLDDGTRLLVYSLGRDSGWLWTVTPDGRSEHPLEHVQEIELRARQAHRLFERAREPESASRLSRLLADLGRDLLGPVAEELGDERLVVVADGALHYLPFAALTLPAGAAGAGEPVVTRHEVTYLPSLAVLAELRRIQQERAVAPRTLAVLADPVVSADDPRLAGHRPPAPVRDDGLRRLPNTADEAAAILDLVAPADRYAALGFDAGLSALRSGAFGRHRIVHLAVHGEIDETHPERSRLVLSRYLTDGRAVPGELRLADVYGLEMPAKLVVLSACRSALGKEVQGEGLVGLTRGFFYAGATRLVVSLWEVNDRATSELMRFFYEAMLVDGLAPAAALRAAQDRLRAEPGWASPFYWAGFVLQGDWR